MLIEDVACEVDKLADMSVDLIDMFERHGYGDASVFGHAMEGNMHLVFSQGFRNASDIDQFARMMQVRSRRPAVLRRLHAIDATRFHQTRSWVVSFSSLRPFGPRRETAMLRAGGLVPDCFPSPCLAGPTTRTSLKRSIRRSC